MDPISFFLGAVTIGGGAALILRGSLHTQAGTVLLGILLAIAGSFTAALSLR